MWICEDEEMDSSDSYSAYLFQGKHRCMCAPLPCVTSAHKAPMHTAMSFQYALTSLTPAPNVTTTTTLETKTIRQNICKPLCSNNQQASLAGHGAYLKNSTFPSLVGPQKTTENDYFFPRTRQRMTFQETGLAFMARKKKKKKSLSINNQSSSNCQHQVNSEQLIRPI